MVALTGTAAVVTLSPTMLTVASYDVGRLATPLDGNVKITVVGRGDCPECPECPDCPELPVGVVWAPGGRFGQERP